MNRSAQHGVLLVASVAVSLATVGCSTAPRTLPPRSDAGALPTTLVPADTRVVDLKGVVVTVEITTGPGPSLSIGYVSAQATAPPADGLVRVTVYSKAVNSTESTVNMPIRHNFPNVQDAKGRLLEPGIGTAMVASGTVGGRRAGPDGLRPGGTVETAQWFDLRPGQKGPWFVWDFGDLGTVRLTVP